MTFWLVQNKYEYICLGLGQAKKAVRVFSVHTVQCTMYTLIYSVHIVQTVQCTQCTHPLLETSPAALCTHSTAELLSHVEAVRPPGWA